MRYSLPLCLAAFLTACGGDPAPAPAPASAQPQELTRDQIITAWHQIYAAGADQLDARRATIFALKLAEDGPEGLRPILDALKDPAGDPVAKVLAVISLTPILRDELSPEMAAALETEFLQNTEPEAEDSTRACSAHLLAYLDTDAANERSRALTDDADPRVQMAAVLAALQHGRMDEIQDRVEAVWNDENTLPQDRDQFVLVLPETAEYNAIRAEAILNDEITFESRMQALNVLARVGDESVYDELAACAEEAPEAALRDLAGKALASLKELGTVQLEATAAAVPESTPPAE